MDGLTVRTEDLGLSDEALERVKAGEPIAITRAGQLFARVKAPTGFFTPLATDEERRALWEDMRRGREELRERGFTLSQEEIRRLRDDHGSED